MTSEVARTCWKEQMRGADVVSVGMGGRERAEEGRAGQIYPSVTGTCVTLGRPLPDSCLVGAGGRARKARRGVDLLADKGRRLWPSEHTIAGGRFRYAGRSGWSGQFRGRNALGPFQQHRGREAPWIRAGPALESRPRANHRLPLSTLLIPLKTKFNSLLSNQPAWRRDGWGSSAVNLG